jgi:hypothetical protein
LEQFPTISIVVGSTLNRRLIKVQPSDYTLGLGGEQIMLLIQPHPNEKADYILMGVPFMRAFYTVFDLENGRMGLAGNVTDHN